MNKTIIGVYGRQSEGKSDTIKKVCQEIIAVYPNAATSTPAIDYSGDILLTIQLGAVKIGFESQGDPNARTITQDTLRKLADVTVDPLLGGCDIIICASRTKRETVKKIDEIADTYSYDTLWISSFWSPGLNHQVLNRFAALNIVEIIKALIAGKL